MLSLSTSIFESDRTTRDMIDTSDGYGALMQPTVFFNWCLADAEFEVRNGYPALSLLRNGWCDAYLEYASNLEYSRKLELGLALVRRAHPLALVSLGENLSEDEMAEIRNWDDFRIRYIGITKGGRYGDLFLKTSSELRTTARKRLLNLLKARSKDASTQKVGTNEWNVTVPVNGAFIGFSLTFKSNRATFCLSLREHPDWIYYSTETRNHFVTSLPAWLGVFRMEMRLVSEEDLVAVEAALTMCIERFRSAQELLLTRETS